MKISIGSNIIDGPWGGGNQFALSLHNYLIDKGWEVTTSLRDKDIDIILMTEPRITSATGKYNQLQISRYVFNKPDTIVVHRINECDERKNTRGVNKYLMRANKVADFTIFISDFLRNLFVEKGFYKKKSCKVIRNGADRKIFNTYNKTRWDKKSPLKIVTHHWGYNYLKGFDAYYELDKISRIGEIYIQFSYIGRLPEDHQFKKCNIIEPLSGKDLAEELKKHHIYITGSMNEPAGMHHIEGALCGLPLLYRNSGALPEYCSNFGVMFENPDQIGFKLEQLIKNYDYFFCKLKEYPYNSDLMVSNYEDIFLELLKLKENFYTKKRSIKYLKIFLGEFVLNFFNFIYLKLKNILRKLNNFRK